MARNGEGHRIHDRSRRLKRFPLPRKPTTIPTTTSRNIRAATTPCRPTRFIAIRELERLKAAGRRPGHTSDACSVAAGSSTIRPSSIPIRIPIIRGWSARISRLAAWSGPAVRISNLSRPTPVSRMCLQLRLVSAGSAGGAGARSALPTIRSWRRPSHHPR
jgi:hypothetical protein